MAPIRAVLVDLDGTLLDTVADLAAAINRVHAELGLPARDSALIATFVGKGLPTLVRRALAGTLAGEVDEALFDRAWPLFERHYAAESGRQAKPYPGAREGIDRMRAQDLRLACVTNKSERFTLELLRDAGFLDAFEVAVCGDRVPRKKPDPAPFLLACERLAVAPAEALVIGDSDNDVQAARAAGCPVWCVPYGYNEGRPFETLACDRAVATLAEAAQFLERHARERPENLTGGGPTQ
jgi:phosphoglycolate phosphatase